MSLTQICRAPQILKLACFGFLAFVVSVSHASQTQTPSSVEGSVIDGQSGEPLSGVQVVITGSTADLPFSIISPAPTPSFSSVTDSRGHFAITGIPPGRYHVMPVRTGFVFLSGRQPTRKPGAWVQAVVGKVENVALKMVREGVISGRVGTPNNAPLPAGGSATLLRYVHTRSGQKALDWVPGITYDGPGSFVKINDNGEFRFYGLPPGDYYVGISNGPGRVFYPGTTQERQAAPIHLAAGEHFRLEQIVLSQSQAQVRFRFVASDTNSFSDASVVIDGNGSVIGRPGRLIDQLSFSVPIGPHEFFVRTVSGGTAYYATLNMVVGSDIDQTVTVLPGFKVTGSILREAESGELVSVPSVRCLLYAPYTPSAASNRRGCIGADFPPRSYRLELEGLAEDNYVLSATANGRDALQHGVEISDTVELKIVLGTSGSQVIGTARSSEGTPVPETVVALVPDEPLRSSGPLYRSAIADSSGRFTLRGIRPGAYRIYAWTDIEDSAYRDGDFIKRFEDQGKPLNVLKDTSVSVDVTVLDANR
jgi:hypothetical protein